MKKNIFFICIILCFLFSARLESAQNLSTQRIVLKNGLTVLVTPMPGSSSVSIYGLVKTGSATEGEYLGAGLSHFMEHMLFKGTERRGVGDIASEIQSLGGVINAGTHLDYTVYTVTVPGEHAEKAADILSDMLMHPKFDPDEIQKEREVVLNEIRMYHDRPDHYLTRSVFETVYQVHPYRIPIIGFEDLLRPLTREDFVSYYKRHYAPNNMILSIAGGIPFTEAVSIAEHFFGEYPRGQYLMRHIPAEPEQGDQRMREEYFTTDLVRISVAYPGVNVRDPDVAALDALAIILGQGRGSRLYGPLIDQKKMAHAVSASNFTPQDKGIFEIRVLSQEDFCEDILTEIDEQIAMIARHGVTKRELEKAVNSSLKTFFTEYQNSEQIAYRTILDEAIAGKYDFSEWYIQKLRSLTSKDIQRVAREYFRPEKRSVVVLRPKHLKPDIEEHFDHPDESPIERIVLENGLTLLLREDHTFPLIWMNVVFQGGVHAETPDLNGVSHLTAGLWNKGSQQYTYDQIASLTEEKGISFSGFSGQNSFGLQMNFLSQDQEFCIKMLADAVLSPRFAEDIFLLEKDRKKAEILHRQDDVSYVGSVAFRSRLFKNHPLGMPQLGTVESIDRISRQDVVDFYRRYAVASNAVVSVFGDFKKADMVDALTRYFSSWQSADVVFADQDIFSIDSRVEDVLYADKTQAAVFFGVQAENFYHESRYGLEVLGAVIGSPFNGRMFSVIRERKGLSYRLGGGYTPARSSGAIIFQVLTSSDQVGEVRDEIRDIVRDIQNNGVTEEELDAVKAYLIGNAQRSWELNENLSFHVALDELYGLGYENYQEYVSCIQAVDSAEIQRLARRYLNLEKSVFLTVLPHGGKKDPDGLSE